MHRRKYGRRTQAKRPARRFAKRAGTGVPGPTGWIDTSNNLGSTLRGQILKKFGKQKTTSKPTLGQNIQGISTSSTNIHSGRKFNNKVVTKNNPLSTVIDSFSGRLTTLVGEQLVGQITSAELFDTAKIAALSTVQLGAKQYVYSGTVHYMMTNQSNSPVFIYLYDCECVLDNSSYTSALFQSGIVDLTGAGDYIMGLEPNDSIPFKKFWKIKKVSRHVLDPGQVLEHTLHVTLNKIFDMDYISNQTNFFLKQTTFQTMYRIHGVPLNDVTTKTDVGLGQASGIDYVVWRKYKFVPVISNDNAYITATQTLATSYPVNVEIMAENQTGVQAGVST